MSIERIDPPGLPALGGLISHVVRHGETLFLSGQVAWDSNGQLVGAGDHVAQAGQVARNVLSALIACGASGDDVLTETVYVADLANADGIAVIQALRAVGLAPPASTLIGVERLFDPRFLVEVTVTARIP
ncbi:enamine deaminase RidA [Kineosporia sp. NBRC 101677]|uniref:RidA family protein n=1 Tax=Kineosporia sp. NBRC 101677 TaxID=3032197 RepID=UPI0024A12B8F|nr:RidA family protein [Kineosporia sp. NBRC 101677]GLY18151.1 enamine deaminase RidA [Kineosporia sp. NBRC 101677]